MASFYFHTDSDVRHSDGTGVDLPDMESARVEAVRLCAGMMSDAPASSGAPNRGP